MVKLNDLDVTIQGLKKHREELTSVLHVMRASKSNLLARLKALDEDKKDTEKRIAQQEEDIARVTAEIELLEGNKRAKEEREMEAFRSLARKIFPNNGKEEQIMTDTNEDPQTQYINDTPEHELSADTVVPETEI
ncbi:hypothetical protein [Alloscardovia criceti]|uniref:hypothetical protein n=1 Tax=Alloscardovia criceti TaxID=356828 RepID=UPI000360C724|nr:hypothetical protein [Alloscardovia criceti]